MAKDICWTDVRTDLIGSRWSVWEEEYHDLIPWDDFKERVVKENPSLNRANGWVFRKGWSYSMPTTIEKRTSSKELFDERKEREDFAKELLKKQGITIGEEEKYQFTSLYDAIASVVRDYPDYNTDRKLVAFLQLEAKKKGIEAGAIDGYWGPQTENACLELYEMLSSGQEARKWRPEDIEDKNPNDWAVQYSDHFYRFYGEMESDQVDLQLPYDHIIAWEPYTVIRRFSCHAKVHDSLKRVLQRVLDHYGEEEIKRLGLNMFGGCLNKRKIRGGNKYSTHSWGISVDYDPANNRLKWGCDKASFARPEYDKWWEFWEEEGWVSLGRQRNFDWMHIQAAKLR